MGSGFKRTVAPIVVAGLVGGVLASGCVRGDPERRSYEAPAAAVPASWDEVFAHPSGATVRTIGTGKVWVPRSGVLNLDRPAAKDLPDDDVWVDVFVHWVHHPVQGDWLIDTGLDRSFRTGADGNIHGLLVRRYIRASMQDQGQDVEARIAKLGIKPAGVFFTHLHGDHTAGTPALSKAIRYVVGKGDAYVNYWLLYQGDHLAGVPYLEEINFKGAPVIPPLGPVVDLFGDGSLWAISTPGHSKGHVSYLVNGAKGPVLLTGDASHTRWGFEHDVEPGWATDRDEALRSLEMLRAFAAAYPQVKVVFGHER